MRLPESERAKIPQTAGQDDPKGLGRLGTPEALNPNVLVQTLRRVNQKISSRLCVCVYVSVIICKVEYYQESHRQGCFEVKKRKCILRAYHKT